jgi:hypothetical protein
MSPEDRAKFDEMYAFVQAKKYQQISEPLDEASKNALGVPTGRGRGGTTATQTITIGVGGGSATVPANPVGTIILDIAGVRYEVPYIATP